MEGEFELWQMARDWLKGLGVIPDTSPALAGSARVYDLALALQDGVVLCNTLNRLIPGSVEVVHAKPEKQFLKMQNINSFLQACPNFGIRSGDLFTADELYYASNFQKVIACLSLISRSNQAKLSGTPGFPTGKARDTANDGDEDMYQSLEDLVGQSLSFQESASANASAAFDPDEDEDDIYGSIRNVIDEDEDVYSDLLYRGSKQDEIYAAPLDPDDKRNHVLSELFETEKNYVDVLLVITNKFMPSLENSKLSKNEIKIIFSNVTELLAVHEELFEEMQKQMQSKTGRSMSAPFLNCVPKMKVYGKFCCEIPDAIKKLKELMAITKFEKILVNAKQQSGQRFHLKDLLNVPMQRVLKYPLLIKELIKSTSDSHPDKKRLLKTQEDVKELATYINKTKKDYDALCHVMNVVKKYKGPAMESIAPLVKDGDLKFKDDPKNKLKDTYLFLFHKGLVWCKTQKNFQFADYLALTENMEIGDVPFWDLHKEEQQGKYTFAWSLKTSSKEYWFAAKSLAMKKQWMAAMSNAVDDKKEAMGIKPEAKARGAPTHTPSGKKEKRSKSSASSSGSRASKAAASKGYQDWKPINSQTPKEVPMDKPVFSRGGDEGWFGGKILRQKAEKLLEGCPDGTYLVRESHTRPGDYSLSVQYNSEVKHIKINREGKMYDLASDAKAFPSIQELVEHFQTHSLNRHFPGMETNLSVPFKDTIGRTNRAGLYGQEKTVGIGRARSRFAYQAKSHDELTFERGIEIIVLSTDDQDPGWWKGKLPDGTLGMFPANYVQQMF